MKIILENRMELDAGKEHFLPLPMPDLTLLGTRYGKRAFSRRKFETFRTQWEGKSGEALRKPAAKLVLLPEEELMRQGLGNVSIPTGGLAVVAIWTLGPELEKYASRLLEDQREIEGILFNVAGSLTLIAMHDQVRQWIKDEIALPKNLNIVEEFYPGGPGLGMQTLASLLSLVDEEETLGVTCQGGELLHPLKSGCSIFMLGDGEEKGLSPVTPCDPCLGKKCLYFQMGGCHMPER